MNVEDMTKKAIKIANKLVEISQQLPSNENPEKKGGFLTIGLDEFSVKKVLDIGTYDNSKKEKYRIFSQEKAHRLYSDWLRNQLQTVSSWQTRNEKENKYGGAVLFEYPNQVGIMSCNIISFSGLNEHCDEALSLCMGYHLGFSRNRAGLTQRIISISNNMVFGEMFSTSLDLIHQ